MNTAKKLIALLLSLVLVLGLLPGQALYANAASSGVVEEDGDIAVPLPTEGDENITTTEPTSVPTDPVEIVQAAYALAAGEQLPYQPTLTGKITEVNTEYSSTYSNVTVTIVVEGAEDMPIKCYRLKGDGADQIGVGDTITVTGTLMNYQHTSGDTEVEFTAGCTLDSWADTGVDVVPEPEETVANAVLLTEAPADGDIVVIYNSGNAMASEVSGAKMGKVAATVTDNILPVTASMAQLQVTVDGEYYIFTLNDQYLTSAESGNGLSLQDELTDCGKWTLEAADTGKWYIKNVGANYNGNYNQAMEYYSGFTTYGIQETEIYQMELYKVGSTTPDEPDTPDTPVAPATLKTGDQVVIFAPAYNKALSVTKTGNYNVGVDVAVTDGTVTGYGDTEIFMVTVNDDGSYSFANGGQNLGMADTYTSMNLGAVNDKWELTALEGALYNLKNTVRGTYMEWYATYSNWSTYGAANPDTDDQFQLSFYVIGEGILGAGSETPDEPDTPAVPTDPVEIVKAAYALGAGEQLSYQPTLTGKITEVNTEYDSTYQNVTVTIVVEGAEDMPIKCYRLKGDGADQIGVGDTVTVTGTLMNYQHTSGDTEVEFTAGCTLVSWEDTGSDTEPENPDTPEEPIESAVTYVDVPVAGTAYKFVLNQAGLGKHLGFTGTMDSYYYATSESVDEMVDVYLEETTGGYHIYYMNADVKTYLNVVPRADDATKINVVLQTLEENASPNVYELNTEFKYIKTAAADTEWYFGTYGTYTTINASKTSYIEDTSKIGVSQFAVWFATANETETPEEPAQLQAAVTLSKPTASWGEEVEVTVSISGSGAVTSVGYIPVLDSAAFEVVSGEAVDVTGSAEGPSFTVEDGGVIIYADPVVLDGVVFRFTIRIKDAATAGEYSITDEVAACNDQVIYDVALEDAVLTVLCGHEGRTYEKNDDKTHWVSCSVCQTKLLEEHSFADGSCEGCGEGSSWLPGDFNSDGTVTDADALYLLRYTLFADRYPIPGDGDVNSDGIVTDADALYLLRYTLFADRYPLYPETEA